MVMLGQLFLNEEKIYHYEQSKLWLTTQDVIESLKSLLGFVLRSLENLVIDIFLKQPDKRLIRRLLFLRI